MSEGSKSESGPGSEPSGEGAASGAAAGKDALGAAAAAVAELRARVGLSDASSSASPASVSAPSSASPASPASSDASSTAAASAQPVEKPAAPEDSAKAAAAPKARAVALRAAAFGADDELDDDEVAAELRGGRRWGRWAVLIALATLALTVGVAVLLGRANAARFSLRCAPEAIVPERGRAFPPWGERALEGKQWRPLALPMSAECVGRETSSEAALSAFFAQALMEHAGAKLSSRKPEEVEPAAALLEQAALLSRAPERRAERDALARLWGDVEYGRAVAKLATARDALATAAEQLEAAAKKQPRYATDAAARAARLRALLQEISGTLAEAPLPPGAGPLPSPSSPSSSSSSGSSSGSPSPSGSPSGAGASSPSPPGSGSGSGSGSASGAGASSPSGSGSGSGAGSPSDASSPSPPGSGSASPLGTPAPTPPPPPPPDAALPSGGVLL